MAAHRVPSRLRLLSGLCACLALLLGQPTSAFYLPGVAPTDYSYGAKVPLDVNRLTPSQGADQYLRSLISYDYYHPAFHFCLPPSGKIESVQESLGSILFGDRIMKSAFDLRMAQNETCKVLCGPVRYSQEDAQFIYGRILESYIFNWLIDGLPAATGNADPDNPNNVYSVGFPLGAVGYQQGSSAVWPSFNNHYDIFIDYHMLAGAGLSNVGKDGKSKKYRVVGVEVLPSSIHSRILSPANGDSPAVANCTADTSPIYLDGPLPKNAWNGRAPEVVFTYSVYWRPSATPWATRWDKYLHVYDPQIHWFSLVNSAVIVLFLCGMVSMILLRALRKDIARYNQLDLTEDSPQEDSGWKLVHGDVFRPPRNPMLLSVLLGSGAQIFFMTGATIVFALLGFLSPSNRGSLGTLMIILYTLFGFIGGYVSSRIYKSFHGESWKRNIILTPTLVPSAVFSTFLFLNFFLVYEHSSGAVPFPTMIFLVSMWFIISVPLSCAGSWFGFKAPVIENPTRTNQIPRQMPPQAMYLRKWPSIFLGGALPFGALIVELKFIMQSIWFHKMYYMFGFLFLAYGIMILTISTVTILLIYFLLCSENYHWHWRSFFVSGSTALYVLANAMLYWLFHLHMGGVASNVLYLGYSLLIAGLCFVLCGTVGYMASWVFVRRIYASIKID